MNEQRIFGFPIVISDKMETPATPIQFGMYAEDGSMVEPPRAADRTISDKARVYIESQLTPRIDQEYQHFEAMLDDLILNGADTPERVAFFHKIYGRWPKAHPRPKLLVNWDALADKIDGRPCNAPIIMFEPTGFIVESHSVRPYSADAIVRAVEIPVTPSIIRSNRRAIETPIADTSSAYTDFVLSQPSAFGRINFK